MICRSKGTRARHRAAVARAEENGLNPGQEFDGDWSVIIAINDPDSPVGLSVETAVASRVWENAEGMQCEWIVNGHLFTSLDIVALPIRRGADLEEIKDNVRLLAYMHHKHKAARELLSC